MEDFSKHRYLTYIYNQFFGLTINDCCQQENDVIYNNCDKSQ